MMKQFQPALNNSSRKKRKKYPRNSAESRNMNKTQQCETQFLPSVSLINQSPSDLREKVGQTTLQPRNDDSEYNSQAIKITKHNLIIAQQAPSPVALTNKSPLSTRKNSTGAKAIQSGTFGNRTQSLDSSNKAYNPTGQSPCASDDLYPQKDGFNLTQKSNLDMQQLPLSSQAYHTSTEVGFQARTTSTNLPNTAKVLFKQDGSGARVQLDHSIDSERKSIKLSSQNEASDLKDGDQDRIFIDHDDEIPKLQSVFNQSQGITIDDVDQKDGDGLNFPKLKIKGSRDSRGRNQCRLGLGSTGRGRYDSRKSQQNRTAMFMTKNSLVSKQSMVTDNEVALQEVMMAQSAQKVRQLFKPKEVAAVDNRVLKRIYFRRRYESKPASIFLRRTSSALMTKYSRKFRTKQQVKAAIVKPTQQMLHNASISMPRPQPTTQMCSQTLHNDSIYTIGEVHDSGQVIGFTRHSLSYSGCSGSGGSRSNSGQQRSVYATQPSYRGPTVAAEGKLPIGGNGMGHRKSMSRAIEAMRLAQLKQSRLKKSNVNRVCEDLMDKENMQKDQGLEQFGRNYLKKLYSMDREFVSQRVSPRSSLSKYDKNFSTTMQSFSIGPQLFSHDSPQYRGRFGAKGLSVQPTGSFCSQMGSPVRNQTTQEIGKDRVAPSYFDQTQLSKIKLPPQLSLQDFKNNQLLQEIIEKHLNQNNNQIVVTIDGDLSNSLLQYFTTSDQTLQKTAHTLTLDENGLAALAFCNNNSSKNSEEQVLQEGIKGTQKPILPVQSPKHKQYAMGQSTGYQYTLVGDNSADQSRQRVGFTTNITRKLSPMPKMVATSPSFLPDQLSSSPPETNEECDQESMNATVRQHDLRIMLSSEQSLTRSGERIARGLSVPYRQLITQKGHDLLQYENQSLINEESNNISISRLNTGNVTACERAEHQTDAERAETQKLSKRQCKRPTRKQTQNNHQQRKRPSGISQFLARNSIAHVTNNDMALKVQKVQSFGGDSIVGKQDDIRVEFDGLSRAKTGILPNDSQKLENESTLRESFERKIVPLGTAKQNIELASINTTSRDDVTTPKSHEHKHKTQYEVSTVGGGSVVAEEERKQAANVGSTSLIHSPQIVTKGRKIINLGHRSSIAAPSIDITMTNYAIDKEFLERTGSQSVTGSQLKMVKSPPDTQSPQQRGKGTKALFQQAQKDPNSFLHTQPIHFDNYHVQARPLAKTIFGKQYKQAQEKLNQSKRHARLIADLKASNKVVIGMTKEDLRLAAQSCSPRKNDTVMLSPEKQSRDQFDPQMIPLYSQNSQSIERIVDLQINKHKESSEVIQSPYSPQKEKTESRITINLQDKDFQKNQTLLREDLEKSINETIKPNRVATGGTLGDDIQNDFTAQGSPQIRSPQLSEKDTITRLPQVGTSIIEHVQKIKEYNSRAQAQNKIKTEVAFSPRLTEGKAKMFKSMARKSSKPQKMTIVQNVQMDELLRNGIVCQDNTQQQLPFVKTARNNPLQTERVFAKFKARSPIGSNKPNFLNRIKKEVEKTYLAPSLQASPQRVSRKHKDLMITMDSTNFMTSSPKITKSLERNLPKRYKAAAKALIVQPIRNKQLQSTEVARPQELPRMSQMKTIEREQSRSKSPGYGGIVNMPSKRKKIKHFLQKNPSTSRQQYSPKNISEALPETQNGENEEYKADLIMLVNQNTTLRNLYETSRQGASSALLEKHPKHPEYTEGPQQKHHTTMQGFEIGGQQISPTCECETS